MIVTKISAVRIMVFFKCDENVEIVLINKLQTFVMNTSLVFQLA